MNMKEAVVVGGSNGIGLAITLNLQGYDCIYVVDKQAPEYTLPAYCKYIPFDLLNKDYTVFDQFNNVSTLMITAGFGRLSLFKDVDEDEIERSFMINTIGVMRIIKHFYDKIHTPNENFDCAVMVSISGIISSPFFSVYSATKAALHRFIESVNVELERAGAANRILEVSPGSIKGTRFTNGTNDLSQTTALARQIIEKTHQKEILYIPDYATIFQNVITRYNNNPHQFGLESYDYKVRSGRIK
ncbi:MAG: SDR family oxidoreductase [Alistipes sp.]